MNNIEEVTYLHKSAVIVIENRFELSYVLTWCDYNNINVSEIQRNNDKFPIAFSLNQENLGWTDKFDRALYYISFKKFINQL